jgi:hypothetical protein
MCFTSNFTYINVFNIVSGTKILPETQLWAAKKTQTTFLLVQLADGVTLVFWKFRVRSLRRQILEHLIKQATTALFWIFFSKILNYIRNSGSHSGGSQQFHLLRYNGMLPTFRRSMPPPSTWPKNMPSKKSVVPASSRFLGWRYAGDTFLRNVDWLLTNKIYTPEDKTVRTKLSPFN